MSINIGDAVLHLRSEDSGLKSGLKDAKAETQSMLKLLGGASAVAGVVLGAVYKTLADGSKLIIDQSKAQRDLARTIGSTVEQAGMLLEAADDMMISQEALTGAMQAAIRKGYAPTISGLGTIADKYNAIQDPIAKAKYLMDTFGRSGADMAPLMEKGRKAIDEMGQAALRNGQVISSAQARMAREVEMADDALGDAWDTLRKRMATPFLPIKIFIEEHITKVIEDANQLDYGIQQLGLTQARVGPNMVFWQDQFGKVVAHSRLELEAYVAQQMLRVQWDENATAQVERLRAGQLALGIAPADWIQNTTTIHTTIERRGGEVSGQAAEESGRGGSYTDSEGNRWQYDLVKKKWVMIFKNTKDTTGGKGAQHGLHMIVPPNFPNDSFMIGTSSGEEVIVKTKKQQEAGGGGNTYHYNLTAQYGFQSERSLRDDVRVLELLHG